MRFDVGKVPDSHPGWDRLLDRARRVWGRHPVGHGCYLCAQVRQSELSRPSESDDEAFWRAKVA